MRSAPMPLVRSLLVVEHAHEDGDDGEDHDDFNGHREDADDGAQGAVKEIGEDELVHSWACSGEAATRASLAFKGISQCGDRAGRVDLTPEFLRGESPKNLRQLMEQRRLCFRVE